MSDLQRFEAWALVRFDASHAAYSALPERKQYSIKGDLMRSDYELFYSVLGLIEAYRDEVQKVETTPQIGVSGS